MLLYIDQAGDATVYNPSEAGDGIPEWDWPLVFNKVNTQQLLLDCSPMITIQWEGDSLQE